MSGRQNFPSNLATKCRFCGCPVVDDSVSLSTVDAAKLSNWSVARTGVPIAEESAAASWSCMNCVREAKRFCEMNPLNDDCIWWNEIKDRFYDHYLRGWMKSCSVAVRRLPEDQVGRLLDCSQQSVIEPEAETVKQEYDIEVKVEIVEGGGDIMEVDLNDSNTSSKSQKKNQSLAPPPLACSHCDLMKPHELPEQHIATTTCSICQENFPCRGLYRCHEVECFFECSLCPKKCKTMPKLDKHLNSSHKFKTGFWQDNKIFLWSFICEKCNEGFQLETPFLQHKRKCYEGYICDSCGESFGTEHLFLRHLHKDHNFKFDVEKSCKRCSELFFSVKTFKYHKNHSCQNQVLVACKECGKKFEDHVLKKHIGLCHRAKETTRIKIWELSISSKHILICQFCKECFNSEPHIYNHLFIHHKKGVLPVKCVHCKLSTSTYDIRRGHYCPSRPKVACSNCNLMMYEEFLFLHQIIYKCSICDISFPCEYLFQQHLTERTFPCLFCGKEYCEIPTLTDHVHSEHGKDKEVVVSWRGLEYSHVSSKCDTCKIYFKTTKKLGKHIQNYHKKLPCVLCAKMFSKNSFLRLHLINCHNPELYFKAEGLTDTMAELELEKLIGTGPKTTFKRKATRSQPNKSAIGPAASSQGTSPMSSQGENNTRKEKKKNPSILDKTKEKFQSSLINPPDAAGSCYDVGLLQPIEEIFIEESDFEAPEENTSPNFSKRVKASNGWKHQKKTFTLYVKEDRFVYGTTQEPSCSSNKEASWVCGTCSLPCLTKSELEGHVLSSHTKFKMFCSLCKAEFSNGATYKRHMDSHHKDFKRSDVQGGTVSTKCDICVGNFEENTVDLDHGPFSHLKRCGDLVTCLICKVSFGMYLLGVEHVKAEHVLESCVACAALMLGKYLEIHFSCCHSPDQEPYISLEEPVLSNEIAQICLVDNKTEIEVITL